MWLSTAIPRGLLNNAVLFVPSRLNDEIEYSPSTGTGPTKASGSDVDPIWTAENAEPAEMPF